ncbi:hypothetical protein AYK21_05005 [Thermoplasmatales archaeon SG8-52-2]|nr:MAG: hypothetical protein AYK21_05005 [Thermoplasmatales archaeon SG8-52-2]
MIIRINKRTLVILFVFLLLASCFIPLTITQKINCINNSPLKINEGQILFVPMQAKTAYLINYDGSLNHSWDCDYRPGEAVYLLEDKSVLIAIKLTYLYGGAGGGIQRIGEDGTLLWDFRYYNEDYLSHHDFEILPNGNILMIAWDFKTREEAINAGKDPNKLTGSSFMPDHIIEVEPTGPSSGDIVWEWHSWDHLIQDYDSQKDNYGVVEDHPELIDINFGGIQADWLHCNSIDYNEEFDQIIISSRTFSEVWVIDHSTTTEEAAGHSGGNSGKGGDLLYRWGNPQAYGAGRPENQMLFQQHDAQWIEEGCPGEGNILIYNNGVGRPGYDYTSVDEIIPPVDENGNYTLETGEAFGPDNQTWVYDSDFFAWYIGGAQRLPNGNTMICNGPGGDFIEVTPEKVIIWEYENPYPNPVQNNVFKFKYYLPEAAPPEDPNLDCEGNLYWNYVEPGETVEDSFTVKNIGGARSLLNWEINKTSIEWGNWVFEPESGTNLTPEDGPVTVKVILKSPYDLNTEFEGFLRVENKNDSEDYDVVPVYLKTPRKRSFVLSFFDIIYLQIDRYPILNLILKKIEYKT